MAKKMKGLVGLLLALLPSAAAFIGGWFLIGQELTLMILGWILVIFGAIGLIGIIATLLRGK